MIKAETNPGRRLGQQAVRGISGVARRGRGEQIYKATELTVRDILAQKNRAFSERVKAGEQKRVYYICLEFLVGRSLRMNLNNLGLEA